MDHAAGSIAVTGIHRPLLSLFAMPSEPTEQGIRETTTTRKKTLRDVDWLAPIKILFEKDIFCALLFNSIV